MIVRVATPQDAEAITQIYAPYVDKMAVTFEVVAPSVEEIRRRMVMFLENYPYLVAEEDGKILGFTYAHAFRPRAAYIHAVETSIYVDMDCRAKGIGGALYRALDAVSRLQNVYNLNACIAHVEPADEFVPETSRLFHEHMGYKLCGTFTKCGRKFDRWYDMIWMEKLLVDEFPDQPDDFIPFSQLDPEAIAQAIANS